MLILPISENWFSFLFSPSKGFLLKMFKYFESLKIIAHLCSYDFVIYTPSPSGGQEGSTFHSTCVPPCWAALSYSSVHLYTVHSNVARDQGPGKMDLCPSGRRRLENLMPISSHCHPFIFPSQNAKLLQFNSYLKILSHCLLRFRYFRLKILFWVVNIF